MKQAYSKRWLVVAVAGWFVVCVGGVGLGQQDVLISGGPIELSVEPLTVEARVHDVLLALTDDGDESVQAPEGEYWLGVQIAALPEVVRQQLGVEHGLAVEDVLADSPAAKAEIKRFDILVKADETPLKEPADLIKSVEASQGKEITIRVVRTGKPQTVRVTAIKRPESERTVVRTVRPELAGEIKRLEEALQKLKAKAGDGSFGLMFAKPAVVAPRAEVNRAWSAFFTEKGEFPMDLSVRINKEGNEPAKIIVKRGDKEWNTTEDKLDELPEDIRSHIQRYLGKGAPFHLSVPMGGQGSRSLRVTPEGKVEGELRFAPAPAAAPAAPKPPTPPAAVRVRPTPPVPPAATAQAARIFSSRSERSADGDDAKLDAILKKLDAIERLDEQVKQLRKELDDVRTKSPGDRK